MVFKIFFTDLSNWLTNSFRQVQLKNSKAKGKDDDGVVLVRPKQTIGLTWNAFKKFFLEFSTDWLTNKLPDAFRLM